MAELDQTLEVFKKGWETLRENPVLVIPSLVALLIVLLLSVLLIGSAFGMMGGAGGPPGAGMGRVGVMAGSALLVTGLGVLLGMVAGGMTVAMAHDAIVGRMSSLGNGLAATQRRLADLIIASILASLVMMVGFTLFVIPGLIAAFFLLFTLPAVMLGGENGTGALSASVKLVSAHLGETLLIAIGLLLIGIGVVIVGAIFRFIPVLGALVGLILQAALAAYGAAVITAAYRRAEGLR